VGGNLKWKGEAELEDGNKNESWMLKVEFSVRLRNRSTVGKI
jgi:hypothetical protein